MTQTLVKTKEQIDIMREAGRRLAWVFEQIEPLIVDGVSTQTLEDQAREAIFGMGDVPAFLNYKPHGAKRSFPAALCVSVNDEVVHGIPNEHPQILKNGDIVSVDSGLKHNGYFSDMCKTYAVGVIDPKAQKLLRVAEKALEVGISAVAHGVYINEIGKAIEKYVKANNFSIAEELCGHGIGSKPHELPFVCHFDLKENGMKLQEGMTITIEPTISEGKGAIYLTSDGWTYKTKDKSRTAQFEHTIVVTKTGAEILTIN